MTTSLPPRADEPVVTDPANRTRLAWTRTSLAFAAIGAAMLKTSPVAGGAVLVLSVPIWAVARRFGRDLDVRARPAELRLVTIIVVLVAIAALVVALTGHSQGGVGRLLHES